MNKTLKFSKAVIACLALTCSLAFSQGYPSKPLRIITPDQAGGVVDVLMRNVGNRISEQYKIPVIVENRPGADGMIGLDACAKAPADGYTLCGVAIANMVITPNLKKVPIDPLTDLAAITPLVRSSGVVFVNPKVPVSNLKELVALSKTRPGGLTYASFGNGTIPHLMFEWLKKEYGFEMLHVPYLGGPKAVAAVIGGETDVGYFAIGGAAPNIVAGRIKGIAVDRDSRSPLLPDVPTLKESGPGFLVNPWFGVVTPKGVPLELRKTIARQLATIVNSQEFSTKFAGPQGYDAFVTSPAEFEGQLKSESANAAKLIKALNIKAD